MPAPCTNHRTGKDHKRNPTHKVPAHHGNVPREAIAILLGTVNLVCLWTLAMVYLPTLYPQAVPIMAWIAGTLAIAQAAVHALKGIDDD